MCLPIWNPARRQGPGIGSAKFFSPCPNSNRTTTDLNRFTAVVRKKSAKSEFAPAGHTSERESDRPAAPQPYNFQRIRGRIQSCQRLFIRTAMMIDLFGIAVTVYVALGLTMAIFNQGVFWGKISDSERIGLYSASCLSSSSSRCSRSRQPT